MKTPMPPFEIENLNSLKQFEGREFPATDWFVITQDRIQKFADVTEDRQWIHVNAERAQSESPFGGNVAHGFLTLSLLSYFLKQAIHIRSGIAMSVNYGLNKVRFPSPVLAGSAVRARVTLLSAKLMEKESGEFVKKESDEFMKKESRGFTKKESRGFVDAVFLIHVASESAEKPCCVAEWLVRYYPL
ncbi:MAG: MaoC family dehydratase [Candidatus Sulfotelmatobacter sp.]